ncbi:hypothetical protein ACFLVU_01755 [Chloroflexota bacterium]
MLTIFTIPKPFSGHTSIIQSNAIQSWLQLRPACEIILFGDEEGTSEIASRLETRHVPSIGCNEYGTPLVSSVFSTAQEIASHEIACYVNADIIFMSDFSAAINLIDRKPFFCVGRRWDIDIKEMIDFGNTAWDEQLRSQIAKEGKLHGVSGLDYFIFPCGAYKDMPEFAVGRTAWDNWLLYKARALKLLSIDATRMITTVHQNHDYSHYSTAEDAKNDLRKGIEARRNYELLGGMRYAFHIWDTTHILTPAGLKSAKSVRHLIWRILRYPEMHPNITPIVFIIRCIRSIIFKVAALRHIYNKHKN